MKTFKSSLQALRTLRERQEQEALHAYGQALQVQEKARSKLDAVQVELMECWLELNHRVEDGAEALELNRIETHTQAVDRRRRACEHALTVARNQARLAFTRLLAARQARTVVDKVIAAQKRRYQRHRARQEQKELDELASRRNTLFTLLHLTREPLWN